MVFSAVCPDVDTRWVQEQEPAEFYKHKMFCCSLQVHEESSKQALIVSAGN